MTARVPEVREDSLVQRPAGWPAIPHGEGLSMGHLILKGVGSRGRANHLLREVPPAVVRGSFSESRMGSSL